MRSWLNSIHPLAVPVLLVAVVLAVYYPALFNDFHSIDDPGIIKLYSSSPSLSQLLVPGSSYYYRPLIALSFWLDNRLWGMEPSVMHLENILLHCANSLLVYFLALRIVADTSGKLQSSLPVLAALIFALHPVNVEAVAWIAGRTDPLLSLFVLSSLWFWLHWFEQPCWQDMAKAMLFYGAALMTKETALAFVAVVCMLSIMWPGTVNVRQRMMAFLVMVVPVLLLIIVVMVFSGGNSALTRFGSGDMVQPVQMGVDGFTALGFYIRKLFVPIPFNFAITVVHPLHSLIAVAFVPILWWVFLRLRIAAVFFLAAVFLILPALLIALRQVSWTPFAERYMYLPSAFYSIGLSVVIGQISIRYRKLSMVLVLMVLSGFAVINLQRVMLWGDKLAFFSDAVVKSPTFGSVYFSLGGELMKKGDYSGAAQAFATSDRLNNRDSMRYPIKEGIMAAMIARGQYAEARTFFFQLFKKKEAAPAEFLEMLLSAEKKSMDSFAGTAKELSVEEILVTLDLLHQKKPDSFWLYQSGQMCLIIGNDVRALDFFRRAYAAAPTDAHYRGAAMTYIKRLDRTK